VILKVEECSKADIYKMIISTILPRPIAWVSSMGTDGQSNLAPFSFFNAVSSNPPLLAFAPANRSQPNPETGEVVPKDTLRNIKETREFVINLVSRHLAEKMNQTSAEYPAGVDEFAAAGLTAVPSDMVRVPRVGESLVNYECRLYELLQFGNEPGSGNLIIGEVLCIHVSDSVMRDGKVDLDVLQPIGRLGGHWYTTVEDRFEIPRPTI
jgi:flavin reductase (DIM6/NTAB) family NADH-FMN oxidoreductase RutF